MMTTEQPRLWRPLVVADWPEAYRVCLELGEAILVRDAEGAVRRLWPDGSATDVLDLEPDVQIGGYGDG